MTTSGTAAGASSSATTSSGAAPTAFALVDSRVTARGVVLHTYRPTGPAAFGSYE
ncbi:hypothetical protein [Streptomyces sp. NPDC093225]|uniref:hypothetical protein n=1 Tax=Streptomyces sp. NPDC093225 TaxID=3366034 RepID=UPI0038107AF6